jgi:hypothetical protein
MSIMHKYQGLEIELSGKRNNIKKTTKALDISNMGDMKEGEFILSSKRNGSR